MAALDAADVGGVDGADDGGAGPAADADAAADGLEGGDGHAEAGGGVGHGQVEYPLHRLLGDGGARGRPVGGGGGWRGGGGWGGGGAGGGAVVSAANELATGLLRVKEG